MIFSSLSTRSELRSKHVGNVSVGVGDSGPPCLVTNDFDLCSDGVNRAGSGESMYERQRLRGTPSRPGMKLSDFFKFEIISSQYPALRQLLASLGGPSQGVPLIAAFSLV